ncbi:MAG TPA: hypothetical protein VEF90_01660 [Xanthobacteraceae bacterium]|nr:hypothetical protein [Xanthobacteraceae bacterium]
MATRANVDTTRKPAPNFAAHRGGGEFVRRRLGKTVGLRLFRRRNGDVERDLAQVDERSGQVGGGIALGRRQVGDRARRGQEDAVGNMPRFHCAEAAAHFLIDMHGPLPATRSDSGSARNFCDFSRDTLLKISRR